MPDVFIFRPPRNCGQPGMLFEHTGIYSKYSHYISLTCVLFWLKTNTGVIVVKQLFCFLWLFVSSIFGFLASRFLQLLWLQYVATIIQTARETLGRITNNHNAGRNKIQYPTRKQKQESWPEVLQILLRYVSTKPRQLRFELSIQLDPTFNVLQALCEQ